MARAAATPTQAAGKTVRAAEAIGAAPPILRKSRPGDTAGTVRDDARVGNRPGAPVPAGDPEERRRDIYRL